MKYRLVNFVNGVVHIALIALTVALFMGYLPVSLVDGCLILGGLSAAYAYSRSGYLFENYASPIDRAQIVGPIIYGLLLSLLATLLDRFGVRSVVAGAETLVWLYLLHLDHSNREHFIRAENGMIVADAWESPPEEVIEDGDLVVTSGVLGPKLGWVIDHGEIPMTNDDGERVCFSSHWGKGITFTALPRVLKGALKNGPYYVFTPDPALREEILRVLYPTAKGMQDENGVWRDAETIRRTNLVNHLWLPESARQKILAKVLPDGYDWFGMIRGQHSTPAWTCIAACVELYFRIGHKLRRYGVGLFGLFGWFDPVVPIRLFTDNGLRLRTKSDQVAYEARKAIA